MPAAAEFVRSSTRCHGRASAAHQHASAASKPCNVSSKCTCTKRCFIERVIRSMKALQQLSCAARLLYCLLTAFCLNYGSEEVAAPNMQACKYWKQSHPIPACRTAHASKAGTPTVLVRNAAM
jgi:hypothetical protein